MARPLLLLRWSGRDLRSHWVQVAVIALIVAIGSGVYAALGSTSVWRRISNDASFRLLRMHDLHVSLSTGSFVRTGRLLDAVEASGIEVEEAEERLVVPTQVDASRRNETILVPGRVVGVDVEGGGPRIDALAVTGGRPLEEADADAGAVILEQHFVDHYELPPTGSLELSGGHEVRYVGAGFQPEYFLVTAPTGAFMAEANFAVLFVPLDTAARITDHPGHVNDLVLRLPPGAEVDAARRDLERAMNEAFPDLDATVAGRRKELSYRFLYDDIEADQRFWNVFALLILAGAAFAAFNLISRIVESQRREIGIGMALGVSPWQLAVRPLLMGAEVALLGVVFGIGVGLLAGKGLEISFRGFLPLPVWRTPFQAGKFIEGAALGFAIPFLATAWPVWRAVRVQPIEAIRTGHLAARGGGLAPLLKRLRLPGGSLGQMPLRNVLRAPRRSLLTAAGIGAAITVMVATLGMLDSFAGAIRRGDAAVLGWSRDRVNVDLETFEPVTAPEVEGLATSRTVAQADAVLRVPGRLYRAGRSFDVSIDLMDLEGEVWRPTTVVGEPVTGAPGIVIAEKAAEDLGVGVGGLISVRHPVRRGPLAFDTEWTEMEVVGIHTLPLRTTAFMAMEDAEPMGLLGAVNAMNIRPSYGLDRDEVRRALFDRDGVASAQPVAATVEVFEDVVEQFTTILRIAQAFVLLLAGLIAFNATRIGLDERARDHATMFAYGVPVRGVIRISIVEGLMIGAFGTLIGLGLGFLVLDWIVTDLVAETVPEIGIGLVLSPGTVVTAFVLGALAVGLAPLLTVRRLRRMDVPSTLRVME